MGAICEISEYMTPPQAAQYRGVGERTLTDWRRRGVGPKYTRLTATEWGRVRYSRREIDCWLADNAAKAPEVVRNGL
jgi:predicted site-specific integrase-resolvase